MLGIKQFGQINPSLVKSKTVHILLSDLNQDSCAEHLVGMSLGNSETVLLYNYCFLFCYGIFISKYLKYTQKNRSLFFIFCVLKLVHPFYMF